MGLMEPIETRRLRFHALTMDDLPAVHRQFSDPEMCRFFSEPPCSWEEAEGIIRHYQGSGPDYLRYGLFDKVSGEFIGTCGWHYWDPVRRQVEIGYDIWKRFWRQGYISEALPVLLSLCFGHLDVDRIYVLVDPRNTASIASARKLGFVTCEPCRKPDQESQVCLELTRTALVSNT